MPKHLYIPEVSLLMWWPDNPHFNQWLTHKTPTDYGIYDFSGYVDWQNGEKVDTILVNWSNKKDVHAFEVHRADCRALEFYGHIAFKYLKSRMDGITMRGGFMMIDKPEDIVMFRILYGEII